MNPTNLTRAEAQERSRRLRARSYSVLVDLTGSRPDGTTLAEPLATFVSSTTLVFDADLPEGGAAETHVDLIADEIIAATLDGVPLDPGSFTGHRLPLSVQDGQHELVVTAVCRYSRTGEGLHRFVDPADQKVYLYTQFEVADARRMFACFDQPDQKATFQLSVIAQPWWTVISNAPKTEPTRLDEQRARWDFERTKKISPYITALVAGDYHVVEDEVEAKLGPIPMRLLCRASVAEHLDAERIFEVTKRGFEVFEEQFGYAYPFGSYDQAFVPEFNAGAMENAGCVTIRDEYLFRSRVTAAAYEGRDNTILHELAHMWFGDLVTMTWWDDLWLNESFAEWASHFAQEEIARIYDTGVNPWATFANSRKNWAYRQDQLPSTHPIAADMVDLEAVEQNFDGITYAKGASALNQLVAFVGREEFLTGVRSYFVEHAWGNTTLADLLESLEFTSQRDLSWFSGEWLEQAGVNTLRAEFEVADDGTFSSFAVRQSALEQGPTLRTHRLAIGLYDLVDDRLTRVDRVEADISGERTSIDALIGKKRPALVLLNDDDLTYAKIRLDEQSLATVVEHIHQLDDPLARALCWGAAWDMCRDAELPAGDYVHLVLRGMAVESDLTAVQFNLAQAQTAVDFYAPREQHGALRRRLAAGLARLLKDAEPASDHQLAFARGLARAASTPAGAELLRGWLDGDEVPEGLSVDQDLRWFLIAELARGRGRAPPGRPGPPGRPPLPVRRSPPPRLRRPPGGRRCRTAPCRTSCSARCARASSRWVRTTCCGPTSIAISRWPSRSPTSPATGPTARTRSHRTRSPCCSRGCSRAPSCSSESMRS